MAKKLNLMFITHDLAIGGLQQVIVTLCRNINRKKFSVSVLCLRELGEFTSDIENLGIKVFELPKKEHGTDYISFLKVAKILKDQKIDIIHTHNTQPFVEGTLAALLAGVKRIIHTDHARNFPDKKRYMFAEWVASLFAYKVVGVSEHTARNLRSYEKISKRKIEVIPNGIDGDKYNVKVDKENKLKELGIVHRGYVIGLCVRLSEQKGITYLLKAMPEVIAKYPDITLIIAGKGVLREKLEKEAKKLGVEDNVYFIGPRMDIAELLNIFDLYVLPSIWEGLPMVVIEAMAAKCPILATNVGGNGQAIVNGESGILIEPKNARALTDAIIDVLSDEALRSKLKNNGYRTFVEKFSAKKMTACYERLYEGN